MVGAFTYYYIPYSGVTKEMFTHAINENVLVKIFYPKSTRILDLTQKTGCTWSICSLAGFSSITFQL